MKRFLILSIVVLTLASCENGKVNKFYTHTGTAEGTIFHIKYQYRKPLNREIDSLLNYFEGILSTYRDTSLISKFNKQARDSFLVRNKLFAEMLKKSFEINKQTNGAFDITVAQLVNAWGFGFDTLQSVDSSVIDSILKFTGMNKLKFTGDSLLIKTDPRIMIDDNAIAKGQSVDFVANFFDSLGIKNYLVEIGGEIRVKGVNPNGKKWIIGIDKPIDGSEEWDRQLEASISLTDKAIATSGNYRKFYIKNGKKYAHTIDPVTGYPVSHTLLSSSVIAKNCMTADALATAFMVMGTKKSIEFLKKHNGYNAMLIYNEEGKYKIYMTDGLKKLINNIYQ